MHSVQGFDRNMMMICYNLRRLMSIFGVDDLKRRLKDLMSNFNSKKELFLAFLRTLYNLFINHAILQVAK